MYTQDDKKSFLDSIKAQCIEMSKKAKINPSVIAAIAANCSEWGTSYIFNRSKNLYMIPADDNWLGWCYSKDTNQIYSNIAECKEIGAILYRAYGEPTESIKDFLIYLKESRRSINGPFRYTYAFGNADYNKTVDSLRESEFASDFMNKGTESYLWYDDIISIIETNGLYNWDKEVEEKMAKKHSNKPKIEFKPKTIKDEITEETPVIEHMYRVRLDWNKPDTQIFSSPIYQDALDSALAHEGYKIYIDDDGELFEDPWDKPEEPTVEINISGIKKVIHPQEGKPVELNNTLVYKNAIDKASFMSLSGIFYYYDNTVVNGRARITTHKTIIRKDPSLILGYIKIE